MTGSDFTGSPRVESMDFYAHRSTFFMLVTG
jgi:hypothetical protein